MPITHAVDRERGAITAVASGTIVLADVRQHLVDERRDAGLSYPELIDARGVTIVFSPADVRTVVELLRDLGAHQTLGPTAILVSTDYVYGMLRMLEVLVEDVCAVRPFRELSDAERWLQNPTGAA